LFVRPRASRPSGLILAHFVFWYGFLRIFTDYFREYGTEFLGIGTGQYFNALMAVFGLGLIVWRRRAVRITSAEQGMGAVSAAESTRPQAVLPVSELGWLTLRRIIWVALLLLSLTIPSGWTRGVLEDLRDSRHVSDIARVESHAKPAD
ncbi:MAG: prolipoprotein diacylglyceryl transferase, partial [Planctomycetes bacterium]|nr:prolipoprotein diacylglyceryl transferase [Planctomycetota bacterium]